MKLIPILFLFLLFVVAFSLRIFPLQESCGWDDCSYLQNAEVMFGFKNNNYDEFFYRPLLISVLFGIGFIIWHHIFVASIITALLGSIGVMLFYFIGKELYNKKVGWVAALIACFLPALVSNSNTMLADVPGLSFLSFSFYFFILFYKSKKPIFGYLSGMFVGLTILMRYAALLDFLVLFLVFSVFFIVSKRKNLIKCIFSKQTFIGAFIVLFLYLLSAFIFYGFGAIPLFQRAARAVSGWDTPFLFYVNIFPWYFSLIVFFGIFFLIFYWFNKSVRAKKQKKEIKINTSDLSLLIWFFALFIFMCFTPHKEDRYLLLPLAIPSILLGTRGILLAWDWINSKKNVLGKAILFFIFLMLICFSFAPVILNLNQPLIDNAISEERIIIKTLQEKGYLNDTLIYTNYLFPHYAYHSNFKIRTVYQSEERFFPDYYTLTKPGFLVYYKEHDFAPGLNWADQRNELTRFMETKNIVVYQFDPLKMIN